jgi:hypothetical protein
MGVAVIFGLTVATVLTLVVVPVTYHSLDSLSGALSKLSLRRHRSRKAVRSSEEFPEGSGVSARETTGEAGV